MMTTIFSYWPFLCLLWKDIYSGPLSIFKLSFYYGVVIILYFWYKSCIRYMIYKYLFLFGGYSFHFLGSDIWSKKVLHFDKVQLIYIFFLFLLVCLVLFLRNHWLIQDSEDLCLYFSCECFLFSFYVLVSDSSCICCETEDQLHSFPCGYPIISVPFTLKTIFPIEFSWHPCWKMNGS